MTNPSGKDMNMSQGRLLIDRAMFEYHPALWQRTACPWGSHPANHHSGQSRNGTAIGMRAMPTPQTNHDFMTDVLADGNEANVPDMPWLLFA